MVEGLTLFKMRVFLSCSLGINKLRITKNEKKKMNASKNKARSPKVLTNHQRIVNTFKVLTQNNEEGIITVDDMAVRLTPKGVELSEIVEFLRSAPKSQGDFIEGRRGHPSRFVFGEAFDKWKYQEARRVEWRKANGLNPLTGGPLKPGRRGRPLGSKNLHRGPGRPPGAKNKIVNLHRGPGRPPGSKNKSSSNTTKDVSFRVTIGDKEVSIPVKLEVAA